MRQVYEEYWKRYRRYRNEFFLVLLGSIPAFVASAVLGHALFHTDVLGPVVAFVLLLLFLFTGGRFQTFRCPRCGKFFQ
jgi:hypothetical protein